MNILSRRDTTSALITGITTGVSAWRILVFLDRGLPLGLPLWMLVPLVPILWLCGVQFGYLLAEWFRPMAQFGKFAAIGFANAAVDFGVLYLLIGWTGHTDGIHFTLFKTASFSVAVVHSYAWNKYWAFDAGAQASSGRQLASFAAVSLASLVVNVGIASAVVAIGPLSGFDAASWAGISAIVGSSISLIFSFVGFRMFVFKKK